MTRAEREEGIVAAPPARSRGRDGATRIAAPPAPKPDRGEPHRALSASLMTRHAVPCDARTSGVASAQTTEVLP